MRPRWPRNPFRQRPDEHPGVAHRWEVQMVTVVQECDPALMQYPKLYVCVFCGKHSIVKKPVFW